MAHAQELVTPRLDYWLVSSEPHRSAGDTQLPVSLYLHTSGGEWAFGATVPWNGKRARRPARVRVHGPFSCSSLIPPLRTSLCPALQEWCHASLNGYHLSWSPSRSNHSSSPVETSPTTATGSRPLAIVWLPLAIAISQCLKHRAAKEMDRLPTPSPHPFR